MINNILVILWIASVICIFYFWKKKPNKKYKWASIVACIALFFAIGLLPSNTQKSSQKQHVSNTSSSSMPKSSSKTAKKENDKTNSSKLQAFAQSFGTKPVEEIQRMPSTYVTTQDDNNNTVYGWHPEGLPELVRVDSENNNTDVYLFDEHGENGMLGKHLYHGRTIYQKQKRPIVYD